MRLFGSYARVGAGPLLVAEADESDRSFLLLRPQVAVVTNIDQEHLESYRDFDGLVEAFERFAESVPSTGAAVLCVDDPHVRAIAVRTTARVVTYGLDEPSASLGARDLNLEGYGSSATIIRRTAGGEAVLGTLSLGVPGRHNVANAMAAIGVALELNVPFERASAALAQFRGAERRFERKGAAGGVVVIDDYGHHPTEIGRCSRPRARPACSGSCACFSRIATRGPRTCSTSRPALALADEIVLTDIYPAGEEPIPGVTIERLAKAVEQSAPGRVRVVKGLADLPPEVAVLARPGDMVITLGAGSINTVGPRILEEIRACRP